MAKFSALRVPDQLMIIFAVAVVVITIAVMLIYSSESIKKYIRRRLTKLICRIQDCLDKYFSDDEAYDAEWMDYEAWKKTRIR